MRPLSQSDIFQIEITQKCFLRCGNCTHGVAAFEHPIEMPLETIERAIDSMEGYPGLIGLIGGEPTTHSQFEEICRIFRKKWGRKEPIRHGRSPIKDFNKYVHERLFDRTSGRGLWTSLGAGFARHYEEIADTFDHLCVNDHRNPGLHQSLHMTRKELGIADAEWEVLRDRCWVANTWSGSITVHGKGYFCEVAGMLDSLYHGGANGWPLEKGWWKRRPKDYGTQLDLCENCGLALPGPAIQGRKDKTILTPLSLEKLHRANAPLVRRGDYIVYDPANPVVSKEAIDAENRSVTTKDSYMPCDTRVAADNDSVLPKRISAVVVCVGRAEQLAKTLKHNAGVVDDIRVATTEGDVATQNAVASLWNKGDGLTSKVQMWQSDKCYADAAAFNKGAMLNEALRRLGDSDWILLTDADCFLHPNTLTFLKSHALNPGCIYGTYRIDSQTSDTPEAAKDLAASVNSGLNGFFQLFNRRAQAIRDRWPKVMSENFCSAGGIDSWFMQQFPPDKRIMIPEIPVTHIAHGPFASGWNGPPRKSVWRQIAMLTHRGFIFTERPPASGKLSLRLTDTLYGESVDVETEASDVKIPSDVLRKAGSDLIFQGKPLNGHHIHVAAFME